MNMFSKKSAVILAAAVMPTLFSACSTVVDKPGSKPNHDGNPQVYRKQTTLGVVAPHLTGQIRQLPFNTETSRVDVAVLQDGSLDIAPAGSCDKAATCQGHGRTQKIFTQTSGMTDAEYQLRKLEAGAYVVGKGLEGAGLFFSGDRTTNIVKNAIDIKNAVKGGDCKPGRPSPVRPCPPTPPPAANPVK